MYFRPLLFGGLLVTGFAWAPPALSAAEAVIHIQARSSGMPLAAAYIALVAEDEPLLRPAKEIVTDASGEVEWRVPPGKYRLIVGAPDHWWEKGSVFELEARATPYLETFDLRRLGRLKGKVVGPAGESIAGARVGDLFVFLVAPTNRLSALGEEHLASNWEVRTQSDGTFELPALEGHRISALVEAAGYEPGSIDNYLVPPGEPQVLELKLAKGASLAVTWPETPKPASGILQLKPRDRSFLKTLSMVVPEWIWERAAEGGKATWQALPVGSYDLFWAGLEPAQKPALRLGSFVLEAGDSQQHVVELPAATAAASPPAGSGLPLVLKLEGELPPRFEKLEAKTLNESGWRVLPGKFERGSGGPLLELEAGALPGGRVVVTATGLLGATPELEQSSRRFSVSLLPRAEIQGLLQISPGEKMPRRGLLRSMSCPPAGEAHRELLAVPVEIGPKGEWRAPIPAGCTCLILEPGAFAALAWHKIGTRVDEVADAGARKLVHGGTVLARLADSLGQPVADARVDVLSPEEAESLARSASRLEHTATLAQAKSSGDGWAELRGLPPGRYLLRAIAPGSRVPAFSEPLMLAGNQLEVMDPWILPAAGSLAVQLKSKGAAWEDFQVELEARNGEPNLRLDRRPNSDGLVRFQEVPPGEWTIHVFYRPDGERHEVARKELKVAPSQDLREKIIIVATKFRAQLATSAGPLRQAGEIVLIPQESSLWPITAKIDSEGSFEVRLPGPQKFIGRLTLPGLDRRFSISEVTFASSAQVTEVVLPAAKIEGIVVDGEGQPLAGVSVMAELIEQIPGRRPALLHQANMTDELGRFNLEFLQEGQWTLTAATGQAKSRPLELVLGHEEERSGVTLRLNPLREIRGRLVAISGQPIASARIILSLAADGQLERQDTITAIDGTFNFRVPESAETTPTFVIKSPGGVVSLQKQAGEEVTLVAPSEHSELHLPPGEQPESWSLEAEDGSAANWSWLAGEEADRYSLRLAPGIWTVRREGASPSSGHVYKIQPGDSVVVTP